MTGSVLLTGTYLPGTLSAAAVLFLAHVVAGEQSRFRRFLLFIFARYIEVPLLKYSYFFLRGKWRRIGSNRFFRSFASFFLARPFGYLGDTGKPVPFDEVISYIENLDGPIAVGPCRCRIGHRACGHPVETDIVLRTGYDAWTRAFPEEYRIITKEEAKAIVRECHGLDMMHMVFIHCPVNLYNEYVICNCCTCGCVPYIINRELGQLNYPLIDGYYMSVTDRDRCTGCQTCVELCPFGARIFDGTKSRTGNNCYGCGLCSYRCPEKAITMKKLRDPLPPRNEKGGAGVGYRPGLYRKHEPYTERKDT